MGNTLIIYNFNKKEFQKELLFFSVLINSNQIYLNEKTICNDPVVCRGVDCKWAVER